MTVQVTLTMKYDYWSSTNGWSNFGSDAADGPLQTTTAILFIQVSVPDFCILNKIDTVKDKKLVDLVEEEIRELLTATNFQVINSNYKGSALNVEGKDEATVKNAIMELMSS